MALYVTFEDGQEIGWHVGGKRLRQAIESTTMDPGLVKSVQADGHELIHILQNINGIPTVCGPHAVVEWFGDHAKFIARNLP